jgi:hypothetical protein
MIVKDEEYIDFNKVPQSKGVPPSMYFFAVLGIVGIFIMGALSAFMASSGHLWPAEKTLRMPLGDMNQ